MYLSKKFKPFGTVKFKLLITGVMALGLASSGAAAEYGGGEIHNVEVDDQLVASNSWGVEVESMGDGKISFVLISDGDEYYTTTVDEGSQSDLTNGVRSPNEVIRVTVQDVSSDSAEVRVDAIEDDTEEEEEEAPAPPGSDSEETSSSETFQGDGTYILNPGDSIETDRGYRIKLQSGQSWDSADRPVRALLYDQNDEKVSLYDYRDYAILSTGSSLGDFTSRGIKAVPMEIFPENDTVKMKATSNIDVQIYEGWNIISAPLKADGSTIVDSTCGDVDSMTFWSWNDGSYGQSSLDARDGYWLKSNESCELTVQGDPVSMPEIELNEGWNLIGAPTSDIEFEDLRRGDCRIESGPWGYRPVGYRSGYYESPELERGQGYFVKAAESCTLSAIAAPRAGGE